MLQGWCSEMSKSGLQGQMRWPPVMDYFVMAVVCCTMTLCWTLPHQDGLVKTVGWEESSSWLLCQSFWSIHRAANRTAPCLQPAHAQTLRNKKPKKPGVTVNVLNEKQALLSVFAFHFIPWKYKYEIFSFYLEKRKASCLPEAWFGWVWFFHTPQGDKCHVSSSLNSGVRAAMLGYCFKRAWGALPMYSPSVCL